MIQKTYSFSQSSVKLVVTGLPDYSSNYGDSCISIISSWKLLIVNQPEIEGSIDHLKNIIKAFYEYAFLNLYKEDQILESKLIDMNKESSGFHNIRLKSTKPDVKPLKLIIGNAELADIINCFDQLISSENINLNIDQYESSIKTKKFKSVSRMQIFNKLIPPLIALFALSISSLYITYLYKLNRQSEDSISFVPNMKPSNVRSLMIRL